MKSDLNRLSLETSPYLLQHATNPVDWYPWGEEAFNKAKTENKLVLVSIGYSSCHWCHVMEHEAFSNPEATQFMNTHFVNIKVDREERPDIDQIYMNAVQIINRRGGWPLNCFALPNGKPVFGGTYFSTANWTNVLQSLHEAWTKDPKRIEDVAEELSQSIVGTEIINFKNETKSYESINLKGYSDKIKRLFDTRYGGIKGAPKFPMPGLLEYLLEYGFHTNDNEITDFVNLTLDKIGLGGIYDHIGGGFARYSVDETWLVPHFEKMLYDNAQLISIYSKAYRLNKNDHYKEIVQETIDFLIREMKSGQGGFYSAYDADSEGKEGTFYLWTKKEIEDILCDEAEFFSVAYGVTATGNFEEKNILNRCASKDHLKSLFSIDCETAIGKIDKAKRALFEVRNKRVKPALDDKAILSWNGLTISALAEAYISFGEKRYLDQALSCLRYIEVNHYSNGELKRIFCKNKLSVDALLDDYANLIKAYLTLYKVTLDRTLLDKAQKLVDVTINDFFDENSGMFFFAPAKKTDLIVRKMDLMDGVVTSSGSTMAQNLFVFGNITGNEKYIELARQMLANISPSLVNGGPYVFGWAKLMLLFRLPAVHFKIDSANRLDTLNQVQAKVICPVIYPAIFQSSNGNGQAKICIGKTCYPSASETDYFVDLINSINVE